MEKSIKDILTGLSGSFAKEAIENLDNNFPTLRKDIEKFGTNPVEIHDQIQLLRTDLDLGVRQFFPEIKKGNNIKFNFVIQGIYNGDFVDALEIKCDHYTDMVNKFFLATYKTLQTGEEISVYKEYTEKEIEDAYDNMQSFYEERGVSKEEYMGMYVGKPKLSLKEFKTTYDIIEWYYNLKMLYKKMCKCNLNEILEKVSEENNG